MATINNTEILETIKEMIGGAVDTTDSAFDTELVVEINTVLSTLNQIGIGKSGFAIISGDETWADFFGSVDNPKFQQVKTYVYLKVKQIFDPATSATVANALDAQIKELEWRLHNTANY